VLAGIGIGVTAGEGGVSPTVGQQPALPLMRLHSHKTAVLTVVVECVLAHFGYRGYGGEGVSFRVTQPYAQDFDDLVRTRREHSARGDPGDFEQHRV
jgi:hypothetical protein